MRYVADVDAMKVGLKYMDALNVNGELYVALQNVQSFINEFPKEEFIDGEDREMSYWLPFTDDDGKKYKVCGVCSHTILDGEIDYWCAKCGRAMDPRTTLGN